MPKVSDKDTQRVLNELNTELHNLCENIAYDGGKYDIPPIETLAKLRLLSDELMRWLLL